jgi:hypothetical protein
MASHIWCFGVEYYQCEATPPYLVLACQLLKPSGYTGPVMFTIIWKENKDSAIREHH